MNATAWPMCFILIIILVLGSVGFAAPKRVVSLDLCTDWMLVKYASPKQVLALSNYVRQYPVDWIDSDWPTHNGSLESLLVLKPDLVLVGEYNAPLLRRRLLDLGVPVAVLPLPRSLSEVQQYEYEFLSILGQPVSLASNPVAPYKGAMAAGRMLLLGANGVGTGKNMFEDDVIAYAGWDNYLSADGYIALDLEALVVEPPDVVLWAAPRSAALANQFAEHPVLRKLLTKERWMSSSYWHWQCPGPWTWQLIEKMRP